MPNILIVDNNEIFRRGVVGIIRDNFDDTLIHEAVDGRDALNKTKAQNFNLSLLDVSLPDMNGFDVMKRLQLNGSQMPILLLSSYPEEIYALRALRAGASGYLTRHCTACELVAAVSKVLRGGKYINPSFSEKLISEFGSNGEKKVISHESLTDREFRVFCELASGKPAKLIANELFLSIKTISTYRARILKKMGMKNNAEIISYAIRQGLIN